MGLWAFYFVGAAYLHYRGYIRFLFLLNLLLAVFVTVPVPQGLKGRRALVVLRQAAAFVLAFLLLWKESWLPPLGRSIRLLGETGGVSTAFIFRFLKDSISLTQVFVLALIFIACYLLNRRIILTPLAFLAILSVPLVSGGGSASGTDSYVDEFFRRESEKVITFERPREGGPDFDVVILHICSMSWDDLRLTGLDKDPFLRRFDVVFTEFNTVSSYTNPSGIRLLRANCGQTRHRDLYQKGARECYTLDALRGLGYRTYAAIDNDAPSYRFVEDVMEHGHADRPIHIADLPLVQYDFDRSPIYDDLSILNRWWEMRQRDGAPRAALYMDVTTMHVGAHWADDPDWWKKRPDALYREYGERLFANLGAFFGTLEESGRNVVVVFVPEHGAALRGSVIQAPDMREIPLPAITTAPLCIKLIGPGISPVPERRFTVSEPASYTAVAYLLKSFLAAPCFGRDCMLTPEVIAGVPGTPYVSENETNMVVKKDGRVYYFGKEKDWITLSEAAIR